MSDYVVELEAIDTTQINRVGGKAAALGALTRIDGVRVPAGFCVTTDAFRQAIGTAAVPEPVAAAITRAVERLGTDAAYAVRSSATSEDLPSASFAGQYDSCLGVVGVTAILDAVRRCWASLFTARAVAYRMRQDTDDRANAMAVVVQRMVPARAAGVLFTADPVTGDRTLAAVDAVAGLGDALVSGRATPDVLRVRDGAVVERTTSGAAPILTDAQATALVQLGRRIETHLGGPQDIEWCLDDDGFSIVQSRPITTLFPIPPAPDDENRVYVSVGHQQMMTDPMRPLGLSFWQMTTPRPMSEAGGRLFVDVTPRLASPAPRETLVSAFERSDPLTGSALRSIAERGFVRPRPDEVPETIPTLEAAAPVDADPAIVAGLIARTTASIAAARRAIKPLSGPALVDFIRADLQELRRLLFDPDSLPVIMAGMEASRWLNDRLAEWLGERNVADVLSQAVTGNVTSEMGLALLDVADAIRPHPEVIAWLEDAPDDGFLHELARLPGGREARAAIEAYLDVYGMRCVGEIDITNPRWSEQPAALVPMILGHVRHAAPGEAARRVERGRREAAAKEREVLARLRALPDGEAKAAETKWIIDRLRAFAGYREYPKYGMVSRYFIYKRALLGEAERLVQAGVLRTREDVFFLRFDELVDVVDGGHVDAGLIAERRAAFASHAALTPPRVLTSDGEMVCGSYDRSGVPDGALRGLAVSAGTVEGRARVRLSMARADLEPGDILVTAYTDPSWAPAFLAASGLVTEVGGLMTHGAVIAREYGLPAVVGVENATRLIPDGRRIRVHGTEGYVELLS